MKGVSHDVNWQYSMQPQGDAAVQVVVGDRIAMEVHERVIQFARLLDKAANPGVVEWIPTYTTVTVIYRPDRLSYSEICTWLASLIENVELSDPVEPNMVQIPVRYDEDCGPDLPFVAGHAGISVKEVIRRHCAPDYTVYMIGFVPGFPYLGGMDERLAAPRLASPRPSVPAGAVGIGGMQTGVYPLTTPGGWRIIGRTPLRLYDAQRERPSLLQAGDRVRFVPIDQSQYDRIKQWSDRLAEAAFRWMDIL